MMISKESPKRNVEKRVHVFVLVLTLINVSKYPLLNTLKAHTEWDFNGGDDDDNSKPSQQHTVKFRVASHHKNIITTI